MILYTNQNTTHLQTCPMQAAANRADRDPQYIGHLIVFHPVHVFHYQHRPVLRGKLAEGPMHLAFFLGHLDGMAWTIRNGWIDRIDRVLPFPDRLNAQYVALFALQTD